MSKAMKIPNKRVDITAAFVDALEKSTTVPGETKVRVELALDQNAGLSDGQFMHLILNMGCLLAKTDRMFYFYKSAFIVFVIKNKPDDVDVYYEAAVGKGQGVLYIQSEHWGTTCFHHNPGQLEKGRGGFTYETAPFTWSRFLRQEMAIDEALDDDLRLKNLAQSQPKERAS